MCTKHPRKRPQFHQRKVMRFYNLTLQQGPEHFWSCISIWIVFQFTNLKNIFSNFILHYNKTRKRENLLENHIVMKNWIPFQKKLTPLCHTGISNLVSPYFLLVFLWPRFLSFSFATFNRSQEELFLSSLASNSDAKHLFKATFVIPEGRHYYILQLFFYILQYFAKYFDTLDSLWQPHITNWFLIESRRLNKVKVWFFLCNFSLFHLKYCFWY